MPHSEDLRPCPFCGNTRPILVEQCLDDPAWAMAYVKCDKCGAMNNKHKRTVADACAWWNKRNVTEELYYLLEKQEREVFNLAHLRPVPSSLASMLCNMTERHSREVAECLRRLSPDKWGEQPSVRSVHCCDCAFYDTCTRPEIQMNFHHCLEFTHKGAVEK